MCCPAWVKNPRSKISILACPPLWKNKEGVQQIALKEAIRKATRDRTTPRELIEEKKPARYIAYLPWKNHHYYKTMVHMCCLQASEKRTFYLWSAFDPRGLDYHPMLEHALRLEKTFKLFPSGRL